MSITKKEEREKIKKRKTIRKRKRNKRMLLNAIEFLVSKALIDSDSSHD